MPELKKFYTSNARDNTSQMTDGFCSSLDLQGYSLTVSANLRLRYNYRPDSGLYVIYNVGTQFQSVEKDVFLHKM